MQKNKKNQYKKPNPFIYGTVRLITKFLCKFVYKVKVLRNEFNGTSGKRVIIANHESAIDFLIPYATIKEPIHMVASHSIVDTLPVASLAPKCGVITKNQFSTMLVDLHRMKTVVDHEAPLMIYPAGLMTESGTSTPIPLATGHALKWLGADVYVAKVKGTYLTSPKWAKKKRKGRITIDIYKLGSKEDFAKMTNEEAEKLIEEHLSFDAYRDNETDMVPYKNGNNVEGLENVLYKCPKCKREYTISPMHKSSLSCSACGYTVKSDKYGMLSAPEGKRTIFKYPSDWHAYIEGCVYREVEKNHDFRYETSGKIFTIDNKKHKFVEVGYGKITLDFDNFTIDGKVYGEPIYEVIRTDSFPLLPFKPGLRFEIQRGEEIYRIVPDDGRIVMKWMLILKSTFKIKHRQENRRKK